MVLGIMAAEGVALAWGVLFVNHTLVNPEVLPASGYLCIFPRTDFCCVPREYCFIPLDAQIL